MITQRYAAEQMGVTDRWVRKLLVKMEKQGDGVVVHGLRGQQSNRRIAEAVRQKAVKTLQQPEWHDFGLTFASDSANIYQSLHVYIVRTSDATSSLTA